MAHKGHARYLALLSRVIGGTYTQSRGFESKTYILLGYIQLSGAKNTLERVISLPSAHGRVLRILGFDKAKIS